MAEQTSIPGSPQATTGAMPQQPAVQPAPAAQPSAQPDKAAPPPQVNLQDLPQFRQVQASWERQLAEERKRRQEAEMRGLDDFEKIQYEKQQLEERVVAYEQQVQAAQLQAEKFQVLTGIASRTGVPLDALMNATSESEAWATAWDLRNAQQPTPPPQAPPPPPQQYAAPMNPWSQQTPMTPSVPANAWAPDVGGAAAVNATERIEADFAEAIRRGDPTAYVKALRQQQG